MALGKKLATLFQQLSEFLRDPRCARSMWVSVMIIGVTEAIVLWVEHSYQVQMHLLHLILLPMAMASAAIGFREGKDEPRAKLFKQPNAPKAPFMVAQTIDLYQHVSSGSDGYADGSSPRELIRRADAVLELFLSQICALKSIGNLSDSVVETIFSSDRPKESRPVWAVCGRKEQSNARTLYQACEDSHTAGEHIERVFFPPESPEDSRDILEGIEKHLRACMTVRVFKSRKDALSTLYEFHLPRGFGMTWIGSSKQFTGKRPAEQVPIPTADSSATVFIHWGGLQGLEHHGVILTGNADWARHLWKLCHDIQVKAVLANADELTGLVVPMTLKKFLTKYPHYGEHRKDGK